MLNSYRTFHGRKASTVDRSAMLHDHCIWLTFVVLILAALLAHSAAAAAAVSDLTAEVDRSTLNVNETLQLTVSGKLDASSGISLFSLNTLDIESPDVAEIEKDFEILDRQQNYRVQYENNVNSSVVSWTYTLSPKTAGTLEIPTLKLDDNSTSPIAIQVKDADSAPADADLLVEMKIDKQTAYVGEQMMLTVKLMYADELVDGQLTHPDVKDVLFKQLEKQREYRELRGGRRFEVVERSYVVFSDKSGELVIPSVKFTGRFVNRRIGRGRYESVASDTIKVDIKAPPADFDGAAWVPAMGLSLTETWTPTGPAAKVGESITRSITIQGLGLESVRLPELDVTSPDSIRQYPGKTDSSEEVHAAGVTGVREQEYALVPTKPGRYVIPEIRVPWWDVVNDEQRVAVLPEHVVEVSGAPGQSIGTVSGSTAGADADPFGIDASKNPVSVQSAEKESSWFWPVLALVFALLWLITAALLIWAAKSARRSGETADRTVEPAAQQWSTALEARLASLGPCSFADEYAKWVDGVIKRNDVTSAHQSEMKDIWQHLNTLQRACFGPGRDGADQTDLHALQEDLLRQGKELARLISTSGRETPAFSDSLYPPS